MFCAKYIGQIQKSHASLTNRARELDTFAELWSVVEAVGCSYKSGRLNELRSSLTWCRRRIVALHAIVLGICWRHPDTCDTPTAVRIGHEMMGLG